MPSSARTPPCVLRIRNCGPSISSRLPAHAGVLRQAEQIAAGPVAQHLVGERQRANRPRGLGDHAVQAGILRFEKVWQRHEIQTFASV